MFSLYSFLTRTKIMQKSIKFKNIPIFSFYYLNRFGWIRIFGVGIKWKDTLIDSLTFSERNKISTGFQIYNWYIGFLPYHN